MSLPKNPRAVVTGAGSGLGRAICVELARRGGAVIAADIDLTKAEETVAMLPAGTPSQATQCDVSKSEEVGALAERADRDLGGVDLVVNNAGVAVSGPIGEIPLLDWEWIVGVNLWGVVYGCHHFVPRFRRQGSGAVLNVASAAGLIPTPLGGPYCATKAAVVSLSETLHAELAKTPISVTVLCPTFFQTNILAAGRGASPKGKRYVEKAMGRAKEQAPDVARCAVDAVERGELFALPHSDGRWTWRFHRYLPDRYTAFMSKLVRSGRFDGL